MKITGRVTADAEVRSTKADKKVVGFNVAVNRSYMSQGEKRTETKYFECSYWRSEAVAQYLLKGTLVEVSGEVGAYAYKDKQDNAVAVLTVRVDNIVLHGKAREVHSVKPERVETKPENAVTSIDTIPVPEDDLPF